MRVSKQFDKNEGVTLTVPVKGIAALHACKARVLHAQYTQ